MESSGDARIPGHEEPAAFYTQEQIYSALARAKRIVNRIHQDDNTYVLTKSHLAVIFETPNLDALDPLVRGGELKACIENIRLFAEMFFTNEPVYPYRRENVSRTVIEAALDRDKHDCTVTLLPYPVVVPILPLDVPLSVHTATNVVGDMMGAEFINRHKERFQTPRGFNTLGNMMSINPQMRVYLELCCWAFEHIVSKKVGDNKYRNTLKLYWLPACFTDVSQYPTTINIDELDQFVSRLSIDLEKAHDEGFKARRPRAGKGYIGYYHAVTRKLLKTGDTFVVEHDSPDEMQLFADMIKLRWKCLRIVTLAGITHTEAPLDQSDSDTNGDDMRPSN
ncbi:hypothetical protein NXS19_002735 [Fusarium pseudograminearum]|uniref:HNH nuclease domain-containing protein n=1 Tax=Fusarium pseudograminearum (strain CS3096) TaxID=1028729 RepID=K3V270_FUSPC|nr:hypothetical protein FPSE_00612 [Fusarium pseudograminearum CS3096]EKJ79301.1 hypothetical protein FPSE_00612 [Fusarium pseudograminearum CS3096]KAF0638222.1 hypothetical protein FPSE5266_00612 [Fusarium pseudograminearum]UZP34919.1 hypothetical protein NXS19_002735 [Fusarium pseudograminearum]